jgi:hypothetical protein
MFDPPFDAPPILLALAVVAATTFGVATTIAPTPPGDARHLAAAVDRVATSRLPTATTRRTTATALRIAPGHLETRDASGTHTAAFAVDQVTPVSPGSPLARVLHGTDPRVVFSTPADLAVATQRARNHDHAWQPDPDRLVVRRVTWGSTSATLVGV